MKREPRPRGLFQRVAERERRVVRIEIDGEAVDALTDDTLLVAMLTHGSRLRENEFGDGARAGFCLMGACQDCWVTTTGGERLRACTTLVSEGMSIVTHGVKWPFQPS